MRLGLGIGIGKQSLLEEVWTPAVIDGLVAWWDPSDADNYTLVSDEYNVLADKSGNSNTLTASSSSVRPKQSTLNSLPCLSFTSGVAEGMVTAAALTGITADFSIVTVYKVTDYNELTTQAFWSYEGSDNTPVFMSRHEATGPVMRFMCRSNAGTSRDTSVGNHDFTTAQKITIATFDVDAAFDAYINSVRASAMPKDISGLVFSEFDRFRLGGGIWATNSEGLMGEILVYDHVLTAGERGLLNAYMADKWGITLP